MTLPMPSLPPSYTFPHTPWYQHPQLPALAVGLSCVKRDHLVGAASSSLSLSPGTRPKQTFTFLLPACGDLPGPPDCHSTLAPAAAIQKDGPPFSAPVPMPAAPAPCNCPPLPGPKSKPGDWVPYPPGINTWSGPEPQKLLGLDERADSLAQIPPKKALLAHYGANRVRLRQWFISRGISSGLKRLFIDNAFQRWHNGRG